MRYAGELNNLDPDDFFAPLGLMKEAWGGDVWTFPEMLLALEAFLGEARSSRVPRALEGLRLVAPDTLQEEWSGSQATLILDLSEGAWPGRAAAVRAERDDLAGRAMPR